MPMLKPTSGNAQFCNSESGKAAQRHGTDLESKKIKMCEIANMLGDGRGGRTVPKSEVEALQVHSTEFD